MKAAAERSAAGEDDEDHDNRKLKKVFIFCMYNNALKIVFEFDFCFFSSLLIRQLS